MPTFVIGQKKSFSFLLVVCTLWPDLVRLSHRIDFPEFVNGFVVPVKPFQDGRAPLVLSHGGDPADRRRSGRRSRRLRRAWRILSTRLNLLRHHGQGVRVLKCCWSRAGKFDDHLVCLARLILVTWVWSRWGRGRGGGACVNCNWNKIKRKTFFRLTEKFFTQICVYLLNSSLRIASRLHVVRNAPCIFNNSKEILVATCSKLHHD